MTPLSVLLALAVPTVLTFLLRLTVLPVQFPPRAVGLRALCTAIAVAVALLPITAGLTVIGVLACVLLALVVAPAVDELVWAPLGVHQWVHAPDVSTPPDPARPWGEQAAIVDVNIYGPQTITPQRVTQALRTLR